MMPCPVCDEITEVYDSRPEQTGVRRRRRCRNGHRFNTLESYTGAVRGQKLQVDPVRKDVYDDTELVKELAAEVGVRIEGEDSRIQGRTPHL